MKKLYTSLAAGIIILGSITLSEAQIRTGTKEIGFSGSFANHDGRTWQGSAYFGYFYNSHLEILGIGDFQGGSKRRDTGSIGPGIDWHFLTDKTTPEFLPYVGASYLVGLGRDMPDALEGHVGLKQFLTGKVAIKYQVGYGFDPSETSDSTFRATIGLSYFF